MAGSPWPWTLTVITVPQATVLVRYVAPTEVWEWPVGFHAQALERIDTLWADRAQVLLIVAKVEHVRELLASSYEGWNTSAQLTGPWPSNAEVYHDGYVNGAGFGRPNGRPARTVSVARK
jgi:hypothetical protein